MDILTTLNLSPAQTPSLPANLRSRLETARAAGVPPFVVAHDATLRCIAALKPRTLGERKAIRGMGPKKLAAYGEAILEVVRKAEPGTRDA